MKIAIIGTRGIPNNYSGFEQFAENFAVFLAEEGYEITVYNSHNHNYQKQSYKSVKIIHCYDPEYLVGTFGQFIYDFNCILNSRRHQYDLILQLGYTSNSIWHFLLPKSARVLTNMDGLEWKRTKYSPVVQKFLKYAEKLAATKSNFLIADSLGIQTYIKNKYKLESIYIPYGATPANQFNETILDEYNVSPYDYNMLVARMEPENNIETILNGFTDSNSNQLFLVVGNYEGTKFGKYLYNKFKDNNAIKFLGGIFDLEKLNSLRKYSNLYFHGHSVGGTNPSLLEAMASEAFIIAHNNEFNKGILQEDAYYFEDSKQVAYYTNMLKKQNHTAFLKNNLNKIQSQFNWERINNQYLNSLIEAYQSV
jgi:glycosyltransferase involved in cell wall biosynthesis